MKILKNAKALSPVVASIILIAVTVAVSIAVAAWMGALSFNFMGTEQLSYTGYTWNSPFVGSGWFNFTVKNTGSSGLTITDVRVDGTTQTTMNYKLGAGAWTSFVGGTTTVSLDKGTSVQFSVFYNTNYISGIQYEFTAITAKGSIFGPYIKAAP
jgi:archaeal type IV pilus assembly protein PilA